MGSQQIEEVDVLLVGAGFSSFTLLNRYTRHPYHLLTPYTNLNLLLQTPQTRLLRAHLREGLSSKWRMVVELLPRRTSRHRYAHLPTLRQGTLGRLHLYGALRRLERITPVLRLRREEMERQRPHELQHERRQRRVRRVSTAMAGRVRRRHRDLCAVVHPVHRVRL